MSDISITLDDNVFVFETVMRVRNTEIDVGQHLTIEALTAILVESRARFFFSRNIKDINADYHGLIANDIAINIVSRAKAREELLIEVGVAELSDEGGNLMFKVSRMGDMSLVAKAKLHFVSYDYRANQIVPMSDVMKDALDTPSFEI